MSLQYFKSNAALKDVLYAIKKDGGAILVDAASRNNLLPMAEMILLAIKQDEQEP
jgi:hypothetical protein